MVEGFDYSRMRQYQYASGETPTYLKDEYGIETSGDALNIQKLIRGNIAFIDSKSSTGVQAADLLVSGIRKCLRQGFRNNDQAASLLGALMLQASHGNPPLRLINFGREAAVDEQTARVVHIMRRYAKPMLKR